MERRSALSLLYSAQDQAQSRDREFEKVYFLKLSIPLAYTHITGCKFEKIRGFPQCYKDKEKNSRHVWKETVSGAIFGVRLFLISAYLFASAWRHPPIAAKI